VQCGGVLVTVSVLVLVDVEGQGARRGRMEPGRWIKWRWRARLRLLLWVWRRLELEWERGLIILRRRYGADGIYSVVHEGDVVVIRSVETHRPAAIRLRV
jgi:hypothetical protein